MVLVDELDHISWRRFIVLLSGLSPNSATSVRLYNRKHGDTVIDDDKAAEAYMRQQLGGMSNVAASR